MGEASEFEDIARGGARELDWTFIRATPYQLTCWVTNHHEVHMMTLITVNEQGTRSQMRRTIPGER